MTAAIGIEPLCFPKIQKCKCRSDETQTTNKEWLLLNGARFGSLNDVLGRRI